MKRYGYHRTSTREQHLDRGISANWDRLPLQFYYGFNYFLKVHGTLLLESGRIDHPESRRIDQFQSFRNRQCSGRLLSLRF